LNRHSKTLKRGVDGNGQNGHEGNKVAEVKAGSVTLCIFQSRNSRKVPKEIPEGAPPSTPSSAC
jgi:hypothetical protein